MSIRWQLPLSYALIALIAAVTSGTVLIGVLQSYYAGQERDYLQNNVAALQAVADGIWSNEAPIEQRGARLAIAAQSIAFFAQTRITVRDSSGVLLVDTGVPQEYLITLGGMGGMARADEETVFALSVETNPLLFHVRPAEENGNPAPPADNIPQADYTLPLTTSPYGFQFAPPDLRPPHRRSGEWLEAELTSGVDAQTIGSVSISEGPAIGSEIIESVIQGWLIAGGMAVFIAAVIGWFISRRLTKPLIMLTATTEHMSGGDLSARVQVKRRDELGTLAHSFNTMADRIETTVHTLRRFVADAAHEIHTPITAVRTNLELLRETNDTPNVRAALAQIDQLQALANDLLDLSRVESGETVKKAPVDVVALVRDLSEIYASRAEQADLDFELELPLKPIILCADARQLTRLLSNLLDNALKFTPSGGLVRLCVKQEAGEVKLTVQDSGIGIPEEDLPYLFERFKRGRNVPQYAGSGLGLAIVKAISDAHDGQVSAQSKDGTTMTVTFPLAASLPNLPQASTRAMVYSLKV